MAKAVGVVDDDESDSDVDENGETKLTRELKAYYTKKGDALPDFLLPPDQRKTRRARSYDEFNDRGRGRSLNRRDDNRETDGYERRQKSQEPYSRRRPPPQEVDTIGRMANNVPVPIRRRPMRDEEDPQEMLRRREARREEAELRRLVENDRRRGGGRDDSGRVNAERGAALAALDGKSRNYVDRRGRMPPTGNNDDYSSSPPLRQAQPRRPAPRPRQGDRSPLEPINRRENIPAPISSRMRASPTSKGYQPEDPYSIGMPTRRAPPTPTSTSQGMGIPPRQQSAPRQPLSPRSQSRMQQAYPASRPDPMSPSRGGDPRLMMMRSEPTALDLAGKRARNMPAARRPMQMEPQRRMAPDPRMQMREPRRAEPRSDQRMAGAMPARQAPGVMRENRYY